MLKKLANVEILDVAVAFLVFGLFVASYSLNEWFDKYTLYAPGVSLLFIPAGVKLLGILVGRTPAIVGLFFASAYLSAGLWSNLEVVSIYYFAAISVMTYTAAVLVVMKHCKISSTLLNLKYWHIVLMSLLACVLNGSLHNLVYMWQGVTSHAELWSKSAAMSMGDFIGCFAVLSTFNVGFQLARQLKKPD